MLTGNTGWGEGWSRGGRKSTAPAGRRDQCYIVGCIHVHIISFRQTVVAERHLFFQCKDGRTGGLSGFSDSFCVAL